MRSQQADRRARGGERLRAAWFVAGVLGLAGGVTGWGARAQAEPDRASRAVPVRLVRDPAVSPDGKHVAFSWRGDLWIVGIGGGRARPLTTHSAIDRDPVFSPDGRHIAFVSNRSGAFQVYRMPVDGGVPVRLTWHTEGYRLMDWYPSGDDLLVQGRRDHFWRDAQRLFRIQADRRSGEKLLFDAYADHGQISPDGTKILFTREGTRYWRKGYQGSQASQIWLFDSKTKAFRKVVAHPTGSRWPLWHPSGKGFYYVSGESGCFNLWYRDLQGGKARQITRFEDDAVLFPAIARRRSVIVFRHLFDLYRVDEKGRVARIEIEYAGDEPRPPVLERTLTSATEVAFTPDGLEMALVAGGDVWVMDTELREPVRVTATPEEERDVEWSPDGQTLFFVSDRDGQTDIWRVRRSDPSRYWWQNDAFIHQRLTNDPTVEFNIDISPDGKHLAYCRERGDLWIMTAEGKAPRQIVASWNEPDYHWSPDGRWIAYAHFDNDFNRDVFIVPIDGSRKPFNLSRHPDNDEAPLWSPDGRMIAFLGRREGNEVDITYVFLRAEDEAESARDRKVKKAIQKMKKLRRAPATPRAPSSPPKGPASKSASSRGPAAAAGKAASPAGASPAAPRTPAAPQIRIDFEGLEDRVHRVSIPSATESGLVWSADAKQLFFTASIGGKRGLYRIAPPEDLKPTLVSTTTGTGAVYLAKTKQIAWLVSGTPAVVSTTSGGVMRYPFRAFQKIDVAGRYRAGFLACWRLMRDHYYDPALNNRNWDAIRRKYESMAAAAEDDRMLAEVVHLMLGELNGSHLGFFSRATHAGRPTTTSLDQTAHLGVRFRWDDRGPGLLIRDVIHGSPADQPDSRLHAGERILSIDGKAVDPDMDLTRVLNGLPEREIVLQVRDTKNKERRVRIRPISFGRARALLYEHWVRANRRVVDRLSKGTLAYVHIQGMNMPSFYRFERELFKVASGKDGIVIDVRENGGGFTTDHLLTILTQPEHAVTVPRGGGPGYPQDRMVYATWRRPIVVICNQDSFSNAEIFSHAIKTLGRGRLVGVTTAGGVISTGGRRVMDLGFLRMPFRGWFVGGTGEDMELNGCRPHRIIWPAPGELPRGVDRQLQAAVEMLAEDVAKWKKRPRPELKWASQRNSR